MKNKQNKLIVGVALSLSIGVASTSLVYLNGAQNDIDNLEDKIDDNKQKFNEKIVEQKQINQELKDQNIELNEKVENKDGKIDELENNIDDIKDKHKKEVNKLNDLLSIKRAEEKKKEEEKKASFVSYDKSDTKKSKPSGDVVTAEATAYTSYCNTGCIGETATGVDVSDSVTYKGARIIAVDPSFIPLHSKVKVYPKDRDPFIAYAKDTGGDIKGNRIDFLISTTNTSAAFNFGRQNVKVEILRYGK